MLLAPDIVIYIAQTVINRVNTPGDGIDPARQGRISLQRAYLVAQGLNLRHEGVDPAGQGSPVLLAPDVVRERLDVGNESM